MQKRTDFELKTVPDILVRTSMDNFKKNRFSNREAEGCGFIADNDLFSTPHHMKQTEKS